MKKYVYGFLAALVVAILGKYFIPKFDFLTGWFSCLTFFITLQYYEK